MEEPHFQKKTNSKPGFLWYGVGGEGRGSPLLFFMVLSWGLEEGRERIFLVFPMALNESGPGGHRSVWSRNSPFAYQRGKIRSQAETLAVVC